MVVLMFGFTPASAAPARAQHSGDIIVDDAGAVVENLDITGSIFVKANNVTIRNVTVRYKYYHSIRIEPGTKGTRIYDTDVQCLGDRTNGVVFGGYYAERVHVNGCRHDFLFSDENPATIVDSSIDGVPYSNVSGTTNSSSTASTTRTSTPTSSAPTTTSRSTTSSQAPSTSAASPVIDAAWPTPDSTGPRQSSQRTTGNLSSSAAGELISRVTVAGRLTIRHDNVTVRDVTVNGTGTYMIQVLKKSDGTCPRNVRIEYTEINGANAAENDIPLYSPDCGYVFDHGYIHNVGRTSRLVNDTTISNSYVFSNRTGSSGAHRGAVGTNGGNNNQIINNVLMCEGVGCSAAIPMYGDFMPVTGLLVQHNLLATTGSYCAYGGSVDSKPYPNGSNIRFIDNHFSTRYFPTCGRYGPIIGFDNGVRGNVWTGNVWHETGRAVSAN
ncbi:hypothetical protein [Nakamurella multipartita]|uniref:Uncharacterized protein n=1 Tax=Nakamurella multipartita (strain ATCC 700099 / DSM 44233 / CIP 104796 / JCM 9543 / NBRC 105858 / Y-104) TaxID=479431 RepID=C8XKV9_NAKMY|nr:hypothetical protein [Nakamurella multipartita]ACV80766.1 hypothetical protein Namu_4483 [Nakamurella multipartita DSM 44233]